MAIVEQVGALGPLVFDEPLDEVLGVILVEFEHDGFAIDEGDLQCPPPVYVPSFEQLLDELEWPHLEYVLIVLQSILCYR